jgi:hypothetical protein
MNEGLPSSKTKHDFSSLGGEKRREGEPKSVKEAK